MPDTGLTTRIIAAESSIRLTVASSDSVPPNVRSPGAGETHV
ncbi:MAG: hypothetical protein ACE5GT_13435 [Rhodospirillales bacterium]